MVTGLCLCRSHRRLARLLHDCPSKQASTTWSSRQQPLPMARNVETRGSQLTVSRDAVIQYRQLHASCLSNCDSRPATACTMLEGLQKTDELPTWNGRRQACDSAQRRGRTSPRKCSRPRPPPACQSAADPTAGPRACALPDRATNDPSMGKKCGLYLRMATPELSTSGACVSTVGPPGSEARFDEYQRSWIPQALAIAGTNTLLLNTGEHECNSTNIIARAPPPLHVLAGCCSVQFCPSASKSTILLF